MSSGQAHTIWFPELKQLLKDKWKINLTIPDQLKLLTDLNNTLDQIRNERNIQPPMMWCPNCKERHRSSFTPISITAMFFALKKNEICQEPEFIELREKWKLYSIKSKMDIYGKTSDKISTKA